MPNIAGTGSHSPGNTMANNNGHKLLEFPRKGGKGGGISSRTGDWWCGRGAHSRGKDWIVEKTLTPQAKVSLIKR